MARLDETWKQRLMMAGDAGLLAAGLFALLTGTMFLLQAAGALPALGQESGLSNVVQGMGALTTIFGPLLGAVVAWRLHNRPTNRWTAIGALIGYPASGVVVFAGVLVAQLFGLLARPFTDSEFAGPLVFLVLLEIAVAIGVLALVVDGIRDLMKERPHSALTDWLRVASAGILLSLSVFLVQFVRGHPQLAETGEAGIFAIMAGLCGATLALTADWFTDHMARRSASGSGVETQSG